MFNPGSAEGQSYALDDPFIAFHPEATAQLGANGTAHRQADGSLLKFDELILADKKRLVFAPGGSNRFPPQKCKIV